LSQLFAVSQLVEYGRLDSSPIKWPACDKGVKGLRFMVLECIEQCKMETKCFVDLGGWQYQQDLLSEPVLASQTFS
jgi:hypothetical protein